MAATPVRLILAMIVLPCLATMCRATDSVPYIMELETPGGPLPFWIHAEVRLSERPPIYRVWVGAEVIQPVVLLYPKYWAYPADRPPLKERSRYILRFDSFGTELEWYRERDQLGQTVQKGEWRVPRRDGVASVPVADSRRDGSAHGAWTNRRLFVDLPDTPPSIQPGRYHVDFSSSDEPAVGVFEINENGVAAGTFMTTTGDYRYLAGNAAGDSLRLSTFDGAHAFLFHAELQEDGTLKGDFWSGNWWHETWTATPDPEAKLPDPFRQTKATGSAAELEALVFRDLDGEPTAVGKVAPPGTPRVVVVFGSWCPNCHDATRLMTGFHKQYGPQGLRVSGLAFEHEKDHAVAAERVRAYAEGLAVEYPLLISGLSKKDMAGEALPILDRVRSYPTTMFIDKDGSIRAVHTGFTGPATGEAYDELRREFVAHIKSMLGSADEGPDATGD